VIVVTDEELTHRRVAEFDRGGTCEATAENRQVGSAGSRSPIGIHRKNHRRGGGKGNLRPADGQCPSQ
jgi:hypothetical protein